MANIVDDQGNYLGPPVTAGGGGYDSPHSRRERRQRRSGPGPVGQMALYTGQRRFALEQMAQHGIKVPHGVDPVAYYQQVASKQIYRQTHQKLYTPKPAGMEPAGGPGQKVNIPPGTDVATAGGKTPMPDASSTGGSAADTARMKENLDRMRSAADTARGSSPASGAQAAAYRPPDASLGGSATGGMEGAAPPTPTRRRRNTSSRCRCSCRRCTPRRHGTPTRTGDANRPMPAVSKAESRYLNAKFGHDWVVAHGFDNPTKGLPEHVLKRGMKAHAKRLRRKHR